MLIDAVNDPDVISKSEFARRRNVKPSRVTQWIAAKKIFGDAIVGTGRESRIRESLACQQLNRTLDSSQRLGNGLTTRLSPTSPPVRRSVEASAVSADDGFDELSSPTTQDMIAEQRLIQLKRQNERDLIEDAKARGLLVDAKAMQAETARVVRQLVGAIEGRLGDLANTIAAEFKLPQRDVRHLLNGSFRKIRAALAQESRIAAEAKPALVDFDLMAGTSS